MLVKLTALLKMQFLRKLTKLCFISYSRHYNRWVFQSRRTGTHLVDIHRVTDRMKTRLNDPKFGVHYLRNVMVSAMAESRLESIHLSGALGHNDPNTIKKYLTMNYLRSSEKASDVIDIIVEDARKKREEKPI